MRFFLLLLMFPVIVYGQAQYPKDYFRSPMDLPVHLSGSFGELRNNHFHSGLDFRTQQKEGFPVYAAAEGYVSRLKVSPYGYGNVLYIDHPNGYTTVYAHLSKYGPKIDAYVRAKQYEKKISEIELFPNPGELPVSKSELIALSGNSGSSGGPHLHFEYRDTKTEMIINPLLINLGEKMKDTKAPAISGLIVYPLGDAVANQSRNPVLLNLMLQKDGTYLADKVYGHGKVGFAVNTVDKSTGSAGNHGIYKAGIYSNGSLAFGYTFDTFAFEESRYVNNFIDYARYYATGQRFQKLFIRTPYPLSLLQKNTSNGQFDIVPGDVKNYRIEISDYHGNKSTIYGTVDYSDKPATDSRPERITPYFIKAAQDNMYAKGNVSVFIPAHAFYEDFYLGFDVKDSIVSLRDASVPVHTSITISFNVNGMPEEMLKKTFIAGISEKRLSYNDSYLKDGELSAKVKNLGDYKLAQDTVAPKIYGPDFKEGEWLSTKGGFSFKIADDFSGIKTFDAWINGKWALLHYDYKTKSITHNFSDGIVDEGKNDLKITVTDNVGNSATFETHFFRTQNTAPVEDNK